MEDEWIIYVLVILASIFILLAWLLPKRLTFMHQQNAHQIYHTDFEDLSDEKKKIVQQNVELKK